MSILLFIAFLAPIFIQQITSKDVPTDLTGFPTCAQSCISNNHGDCALLDMACMCTSQVHTVFGCMQGLCNAEDQATALAFAQELCEKANATATAKVSGAAKMSASATTLSTATITNTNPAGTANTSSLPPKSSGLSTGATAGIGVGAVLSAVAVVGAGFLLWRRKRARAMARLAVPEMRVRDYAVAPPYEQKGMVHHEADGVQWQELEAKEATRYIR